MSEGLEALKELRYRITNFNGKFNDYNKIMNIIEQELKALEIINKAYGDYANHRISEYELIMIVGENTTY